MAKIKVLSTKKLTPSLMEKANQHSIALTEREFISIKPSGISDIQQQTNSFADKTIDTIAVTSSNAVDSLVSYLQQQSTTHRNIFCISGKTKEAIINSALQNISIAGEATNGQLLAAQIINQDIKEIIFFCSNIRRDELPCLLKQAGVTVHEVIAYETIKTPVAIDEGFDAVLFFSPSTVESFFSLNQLKNNTICFSIGQTTADSIATFTNNKIIISDHPTQADVLESVINYFEPSTTKEVTKES